MTRNVFALVLMLGVLVACKSAPPPKDATAGAAKTDSTATAIAQPDDSAGAIAAGEVGGDDPSARSVVLPAELAGRTVIYFPFDSDALSADDQALVAAHARFMAGRADVRVRLEGHTDERGSREYNIALGERRAQAVRRALMLQGVADAQVVTVSYGEERPAAEGADEGAYSKNRRVEFRPAN